MFKSMTMAASIAALISCSQPVVHKVNVGGHYFEVPLEYTRGTSSFSRMDRESLSFDIQFGQSNEFFICVLVESNQDACSFHPKPVLRIMDRVCRLAKTWDGTSKIRPRKPNSLSKRPRFVDDPSEMLWIDDNGEMVAHCYVSSRCLIPLVYKDLVVIMYLDELAMTRLDEVEELILHRLKDWEKGGPVY